MAKQKKAKLRVKIDGKRRYITVPQGRARDLHAFLREKRVRSAPPEPAYTGFDFIEVAKEADVVALQALLNDWA